MTLLKTLADFIYLGKLTGFQCWCHAFPSAIKRTLGGYQPVKPLNRAIFWIVFVMCHFFINWIVINAAHNISWFSITPWMWLGSC
jgi:hypothetical protein